MEMSEHILQAAVVGLLRKRNVTFFVVPNGGLRDKATAVKLWREGVQAGVPDLIILDPPPKSAGDYVGLAIELKTRQGKPTPQQLEWMHKFSGRRWATRIAFGIEHVLATLYDFGYLEYADIAPWLHPTAATGDGTAVRDLSAVPPSPPAAVPAAPTRRRRATPKQGTGGAG